jgi:hypothetical protein
MSEFSRLGPEYILNHKEFGGSQSMTDVVCVRVAHDGIFAEDKHCFH